MNTRDIPPAAEIDERVATTTVTSFRIIEELERRERAGVSELASALDISKGAIHKHLSTLRAVNYVVKEGDAYRLSLAFLGLGSSVRAGMPLYENAYEPIATLAEVTDETVSFMIPEHGFGVYLLRESTTDEPETELREGEHVPLHATAAGKAILAYLPEAKRASILDERGLPALTDETITDQETLALELDEVHDKRMAHDRGELEAGRDCLAAPVTDGDDRAVGAISISGPSEELRRKASDMDFDSILGSTANSIRNRLFRRL